MNRRNLYDYPDKSNFSEAKQINYICNISQALNDSTFTDYVGTFDLMVKSGEVYHTESLEYKDGYLMEQDSRPRAIMNPCKKGAGILAAIQSTLWETIKEVEDSFIQGYNKDSMMALFQSKVQSDWVSISIDGSAFDSTQFSML